MHSQRHKNKQDKYLAVTGWKRSNNQESLATRVTRALDVTVEAFFVTLCCAVDVARNSRRTSRLGHLSSKFAVTLLDVLSRRDSSSGSSCDDGTLDR